MVLPFLLKLEESERRNRTVSAVITFFILLFFVLLCFFWYAMRPERLVSIGEKELEMVSGIAEGNGGGSTLDYGDRSEGSQNVNNLQPAVPNPLPGEMKAPELPKADVIKPPAPAPNDSKLEDKPVLAGNDDTDVTAPPPKDKDKKDKEKDKKETTPNASPKASDSKPVATTTQDSKNTQNTNPVGGGSNHGNAPKGSVGNTGIPNTNILNIDGIEWGSGNGKGGDGGLNNRKILKMTRPKYDVQEEGRLTYEFIIAPDGNVVFCKALPNRYPNLAKIGEDCIKKDWKFNKLTGSTQNQKVVVTITYKLTN